MNYRQEKPWEAYNSSEPRLEDTDSKLWSNMQLSNNLAALLQLFIYLMHSNGPATP